MGDGRSGMDASKWTQADIAKSEVYNVWTSVLMT